jgi:hypothetical protein
VDGDRVSRVVAPAMKRGKFVGLHLLQAALLTASDRRSTAMSLACSLQGIATGGLRCPDFAQRRRALFSLAALLLLEMARGRLRPVILRSGNWSALLTL